MTEEGIKSVNDSDDDDDLDIEVVDDTPEEDRGKPRRPDGVEPDVPNDDEIASYGKNVQKRIKNLRYEFHEERRQKEEAQREREQAIEFARRERSERERLQRALAQGEETLVYTGKSGSAAAVVAAKDKLRRAQEEGDAEKITDAQEALTKAINDQSRWESYQMRYQQAMQQAAQQNAQPQRQQPQPPQPDPKAAEWAKRNNWFQGPEEDDEIMTGAAFAIHRQLIKKGIDPRSDQYYSELDQRIRKRFPDYFEGSDVDEAPQKKRQAAAESSLVVASSTRTPGKARKVQLTQSELAIARKIGVSAEDYAREKLKHQRLNQ